MNILNRTTAKQKCDARNCKHDAEFFFAVKGIANRCYLCADCLNKLTADNLSAVTPKSPKNTIKRIADKREREKTSAVSQN